MGLFSSKVSKEEEKRKRKCSELETQYKKLWIKGKTDEALATLKELFELGSEYADYCLVRSYDRGYLFCDIPSDDPLNKKMKHFHKTHEENNPVGKSSEMVGFYLMKILERYGDKVKLPHTQLSADENSIIGYLKAKIAYTYYYRIAKEERIDTGEFMVAPNGRRVACTANSTYEYRLGEPRGNGYTEYMRWIKDAVMLNQNPDALTRLAIAYAMEYDLFGLERDVKGATALAIRALQNFKGGFAQNKAAKAYVRTFHRDEILALLKELGKENQLADIFYQKAKLAENKEYLARKKATMEFEHARVSMWEEFGDVTWRDAKTGEKIDNIDAELKKMEEHIAQIEKTLASM